MYFLFVLPMQTHRRQHTGERPYSCVECDHHFANWPNYNKHMKRKHGINTSVNVRKPQAIPPSGMPAKAKLNHVVPTAENVNNTSSTSTSAAAHPGQASTPPLPPLMRCCEDDVYGCVHRSARNVDDDDATTTEQQRHDDIEYMTADDEQQIDSTTTSYYIPVPIEASTQPK